MRSPSELLVQVQQAELEAILPSAFSSLRPLEVPQTALGGSLKASRGPRRLPKGFQESPGIMYQSGTTGDHVSQLLLDRCLLSRLPARCVAEPVSAAPPSLIPL